MLNARSLVRDRRLLARLCRRAASPLGLTLGFWLSSCGGGDDQGGGIGADGAGASSGAGGAATGGKGASGGSAGIIQTGGGGSGATGTGGTGEECASQKAGADLLPVRLAFAFDVSGSMGQGDFPWHDATLKWDPVVAATRAFFEDAASEGLEASLTVFPVADSGDRCENDSYTTPIVPMTALPSTAFGSALDSIRAGDWRGGTPTLHVVNGVISYIENQQAGTPGRYVLVLVTDGYPQSCTDNSIESVVDAVAAVANDVPTYVIGVANPPLTDSNGNMAPETVMNLSAIASAGGGQAFMINTGNPAQTSADFTAAVNQIRGVSISCNLDIPPIPGGRVFERDKVQVTYTSGGTPIDLTYDSTCSAPNSWHYDDPVTPTEIVLCDSTCSAVQADMAAVIDVTFTCNSVIDPR